MVSDPIPSAEDKTSREEEPSKFREGTPTDIVEQTGQEAETEEAELLITDTFQPDDLNFPKLPSSNKKIDNKAKAHKIIPPTETTQFVWNTPGQVRAGGKDKGKRKQVGKTPESTPLTRQGYRSGRLADDFWLALNAPHTPPSQRKTLRVVPILTKAKKEEGIEYLISTKADTLRAITQIHIAELLVGVPWTETRVRQHIVSEVAQALYKVLVFTNPASNPLQKWKQGKWFAYWEGEREGEHTCTLFVSVPVQENKIKPRKGHAHGWHSMPGEINERIQLHNLEAIEEITSDSAQWNNLISPDTTSSSELGAAADNQNRYTVLRGENTLTS